MNFKKFSIGMLSTAALCCVSLASLASEVTLNGSGNLVLATSTSNSSLDTTSVLANPGSYYYGNSYGAGSPATFTDNFIITIGAGQLDAITSTIDLLSGASGGIGIDDLSVALFSFTPGPGNAIPNAGSNANSIAGTTSLVFANSSEAAYVNILSDPLLGAGTYVLQVDGTLLPGGGSYGGDITVSPVPLQPSWLFMAIGVALMGSTVLARRARPVHRVRAL